MLVRTRESWTSAAFTQPTTPFGFIGSCARYQRAPRHVPTPWSPSTIGTRFAFVVASRASAFLPGTAYAIVVHATLFLPVVILGLLVLWRSHMTFTQITHAPEPEKEKELVAAA